MVSFLVSDAQIAYPATPRGGEELVAMVYLQQREFMTRQWVCILS